MAQILLSSTPRVYKKKKKRDDDGKEDFAMHSDDIAVTHNLSPSGFIREGQKSQSCRNDGCG